jgi:hypothetical protein
MMQSFQNFLILAICSLAVALSICFVVLAWSEPNLIPPDGNIAAPVNIGFSPQVKNGAFGLNFNPAGEIAYWLVNEYGSLVFKTGNNFLAAVTMFIIGRDGNVGIGTAAPIGKLDVEGGQICLNGRCCSTWEECGPCLEGAGWINGSCASGSCAATQRQQYKLFTPGGCDTNVQCVSDSACSQYCSPGAASGCAKCNSKGSAWENTCTGANDGCSSKTGGSCTRVNHAIYLVDCGKIAGWVCNTSYASVPLTVDFYMDTTTAAGYLGSAPANLAGDAAASVAGDCGGYANRWFDFAVPDQTAGGWPVHDGQPHRIHMVAKRSVGGTADWFLLHPNTLTCPWQ